MGTEARLEALEGAAATDAASPPPCRCRCPLPIPHPAFRNRSATASSRGPSPFLTSGLPSKRIRSLWPRSWPLSPRGPSTPRHFCVSRGRSDSRPCRPNLKLHKRNPSQSLPRLPLPSRTLLRSTPKIRSLPRATCLSPGPLQPRPPRKVRLRPRAPWRGNTLFQVPPQAPSARPQWRTSGCFLGSAQRHSLPGPHRTCPGPRRVSPAQTRAAVPLPHRRPQPSDCPPLRVPTGFPEQRGRAVALTSPAPGPTRGRGRRRQRRDSFVTGPRER